MSEVFISYARANDDSAKRVESGLRAAGLEAWRDDQLPAHRAYSEIIEQKLHGAAAVVVLWSKEAAQSQWVRAEADFARNAGKLVQAQVDDTLPPMPFNQIQCADLRGWRGNRKHRGWVKLADSVASVVEGKPPNPAAPLMTAPRPAFNRRLLLAVFALLIVAAVGAILLVPRMMGTGDDRPRVAVLPFESIGSSNDSLVEGIWEDTRQALSRNPQLLVLGPHTSQEISKEGSGKARKAADYLLAASVRTAGDRIRVSTSLVRTTDGIQVWSQLFDRKLDDVFALQTEIAQQIEGRIRGRLARRGGVLPEHIVTTGEVYLLYSEARATLRKREFKKFSAAYLQLKQVVEMDPNFAPAWATLAVAEAIFQPELRGGATGKEAENYARRAIALAPNLAAGHAALGFALGRAGPAAEAALRQAVKLDPNDVESLNWLASLELARGRQNDALKLYDSALKIEPLWWPVVLNRLALLLRNNQNAAVDKELERLAQLGSPRVTMMARMDVYDWRGDYSEALKYGLEFYRQASAEDREGVRDQLASLLLRLDYIDEGFSFSSAPPGAAQVWRNDPRAIELIEARKVPPPAFWKIPPMTEAVSRSYILAGRHDRLVELYRAVADSPQSFHDTIGDPSRFVHLAPTVAVALKAEGHQADAERLLALVEQVMSQSQRLQTPRSQAIYMARLRAGQGRLVEAEAALRIAADQGWLPQAPFFKPDIVEDPPLAALKGRPRFEQVRSRVLNHLAKERAELGPLRLN